MIDWLEIRQLAIAEHISLEFADAFTAVTGETGSGKSLIVDALMILLGGRCESGLIRQGEPQAEINGGFKLDGAHRALLWLRENNLDSGDECILRRVVRRDKPSRGFINGRAVNAAQLRELGDELIDIHGQNEHHSLLAAKGQLALLDAAANTLDALGELGGHYEQLAGVDAQIAQLKENSKTAQARAEILQFQIQELDELAPQVDEWPQLEQQQKRMHHVNDLATTANTAVARLADGEDGAMAALGESRRQLQKMVEYDSRLEKIVEMLDEAQVNLDEATAQLRTLYAENALDPAQIAEIESRFSQYHELSRKHRVLPGLLGERLVQLREELDGVRDPQAELARLTAKREEHQTEYQRIAADISERRAHTAAQLSQSVTAMMQELGMVGGTFEIRLKPNANDGASRRGNEGAEFAVSANPGIALHPLTKVASGGELSRISLAINVVMALDAPTSTLIFDEVDVGIGGKVAEVVGRKLRELGAHRQVVCITHLSQVAACGHHHWSVAKQTGEHTNVSVQPLDREQRIGEIARMTAGAELTPQSLAHAERMLQSA